MLRTFQHDAAVARRGGQHDERWPRPRRPPAAFDAVVVLQSVHEEHRTALHGVPTMMIAELGHPAFDRFDLTSLRTGAMAGAVCPEPLKRQVTAAVFGSTS